jgi:hypothetical protein
VALRFIGNYERNADAPIVEVLLMLVQVFKVVDFLSGEGELPATIKRY